MVAIVTGTGTGLERSSGWVLGSRGQLGDASVNRYGENVYINGANGNLVINRTDEVLIGLGPDDVLARTYNSEGDSSDDNGDNWMFNAQRHLTALTGTANTTGSTITRVDGDGSKEVYTYNATSGLYTYTPPSEDGAPSGGAVDTIAFDGVHTWTWIDGSSQTKELYDSSNGYRITKASDHDGNALTYAYDTSGRLSTVTTQDSETTTLNWSGNNVTSIVTTLTGGATLTRVYYTYDSSNRLSTVTTDLSPNDDTLGSDAVTTTYTYDGTSNRVASIGQTGGALVQFTYDTSFRVHQVTQTMSTGVTNTSIFDYSTAGQVSITDNFGAITVMKFNSAGQLTQLTLPPGQAGASSQNMYYTYNTSGDLLTATDGSGNVTTYTYDPTGTGNLDQIQDASGNTVQWTYGTQNQILTKTTYAVPAVISTSTPPSQPSTTRYVYATNLDLIYTVSPMGEVTGYTYDTGGHGELKTTMAYRGYTYNISALAVTDAISASQMATWLTGVADFSTTERTDMLYDARGVVDRVTTYAALDPTTGAGLTSGSPWSRVSYTTDQAGNMLTRTTAGESNIETFTYDGLNRVTSSVNLAGASTSITFTDGSNYSTVLLTGGASEVSTYNLAGQLISTAKSATGLSTATAQYTYDAEGHLLMATDPAGNRTFFLYDTVGRKIATITSDGGSTYGELTEFAYDASGRLMTTIRYSTKIALSSIRTISGSTVALLDPTLASIRPTGSTSDLWSWNIYDASNRLIETILPDGSAAVFSYDGEGHLLQTTGYYNKLSSTAMTGFRTTAPHTLQLPTANAADDTTRYFYDADGRKIGVLDGDGYLSATSYNEAGETTQTVSYATATTSSLRATGSFAALQASVGSTAADIYERYFYDDRGFLAYKLDDNLQPTGYVYSQFGQVNQTIQYNGSIASTSSYSLSYVAAQISSLSLATATGTRMSYNIYNTATGQLAFSLDPVGDVTGYGYDSSGNVI